MNSLFKIKLLNHLNKKNNKGFTLIELLVVVIIIGVLAAIALPNLLGQVAKGRQSEARNNLGSINRAQQTFRLESSDATFAKLADLPVKIGKETAADSGEFETQYYIFSDGGDPTAFGAQQQAVAKTEYGNDILDYSSAVGQQADGTFSAVVCEQSTNPSDTFDPEAGSTLGAEDADAECATDTKQVK
ncbi:pilin polypeptide [Gloeothece citriformis PCC 7424]|uniref:Pilin polypeptide n=1 Tax=Gloeothece citriformis (strain PCC 7424) TaxID=65393 RepID=B7KAQ6_GLOC7|nr:type IV pilin-like G/H family protein [Gloeothece citriformis]ACK68728.1 pilin polypeptide [Gloeothece citriformis PCC 7424]